MDKSLQQIREALGLSQEELAQIMGISRVTILRAEKSAPKEGFGMAFYKLLDHYGRDAIEVLRQSRPQ